MDHPQKKEYLYALVSILLLIACLPLHFPYETAAQVYANPQALLELLTYYPQWLAAPLLSFKSFATYLLICILFYIMWLLVQDQHFHIKLRYIVRAIVRYRLATALFAMGIIKLIPVQLPGPTLSDLHTNYGDFLPWKIYYLTNSAARIHHQSYLGIIEIVAAAALLFRKTASLGAGLALAFLTNVVLVNIAYQLQHTILAIYLFVLAAFVISHDIPRLYNLFFRRKRIYANRDKLLWQGKRLFSIRYLPKAGIILITTIFLYQVYQAKQSSPFPFQAEPGLSGRHGFYEVDSFTINGKTIPAAFDNEQRWQNVVFEEWNTISIQQNTKSTIKEVPPKGVPLFDNSRYYEYAGSGGRTYYTYAADTLKNQLKLHALGDGGTLSFHYESLAHDTLLLTGINERRDTISAKLVKKQRKYLIHESRRKPIKI